MNTAVLSWSLMIDCPFCEHEFDLVTDDHNRDYAISKRIFSNEWDDLEGYEVTCPECRQDFEISEVVY